MTTQDLGRRTSCKDFDGHILVFGVCTAYRKRWACLVDDWEAQCVLEDLYSLRRVEQSCVKMRGMTGGRIEALCSCSPKNEGVQVRL